MKLKPTQTRASPTVRPFLHRLLSEAGCETKNNISSHDCVFMFIVKFFLVLVERLKRLSSVAILNWQGV